ncbi:MAG TPA: aminotransferase class V-fold PLP-dependent enzyme [Rubrivivax sp.]|nr:aminotransferase class V-fold PLP-dependent enzyme [Rubrivivax sp.]
MDAYDQFLRAYPSYASTCGLDALRASEYARIDATGQIYLDYTGGGLYAASQVREHAALLADQVLGNPHSVNPSSSAMTVHVERARAAVLAWFNGTGRYTAIFTNNASAALKLVGESYPFAPGGRLLMTADNHNSVNGMREFASAKGAQVDYAPLTRPALRLDLQALDALLAGGEGGGEPGTRVPRLLAYPAQSNFSGVKHPLELIAQAQARGWHVLLDAAASCPPTGWTCRRTARTSW